MATAAAVPSGGQQTGPSFYDALPEVGDIINNLWTGFGQASGNDAATANTGRSKSKSKSRDGRSESRRRQKSKSRSKARSVRSRSRGAASSRSRGRSKTKKADRPPRHPSSVRSAKNLPGPDNFVQADFDLSAVVALDQRREQKKKVKKQVGKSIAGSRKSSRSTGVSSKKSARSNRNKSARGGEGGSEMSRSRKAKTKTHRSQPTVDTHRTGKSSGTARSNRSTRSNKSSTTAKSSSKSIKSARSSRSARTSTGGDHANGTQRQDVTSRAQKQRRNHRKGISKGSHNSGKTGRTAPTRLGSTVSNGSTKVPSSSSIGSERRAQMASATAALAECRDDAAQEDEEFLLRKVRDDSSDDDSSSSDDDSDSSSSDVDKVGASDVDNDNAAGGNADEESDTETNISRAIRSIGIPIGNNFDEGSNDVRSKRSAKSRGSKANSTKSNRSRRQSTTEAAESAGFTAPTTTISSKGKASGSCDSSSDIDESEFYQGTGGDILGNKYRVVDELGKGTFGRVMKAYEIKKDSLKEKLGLGNFRGVVRPKRSGIVAIKVTRDVAKYKKDAEIEANLLRKVNRSGSRGTAFFPQLIDEFESPMGHHCVVLEKLGMSLYEVLKSNNHQPFSSESVRAIAIQLFDALDHMHGISLIHTDIKPENILLASNNCNSADMRIKLIDLGSAEYERNANRHSIVNTRQYRAPEILLRIGWSFPSDVWAAGCTLAELALGNLLFPAKEDVEHLALIERTMGVFPRWMLLTASTVPDSVSANCFSPVQGTHKMGAVLKTDSLKYVMKKRSLAEQLAEVPDDATEDCISVADALNEILCIDPMFRPTSRLAKELCMDIGEAQEAGDDEEMENKEKED